METDRPCTDAEFDSMRRQHLPYELGMLRAAAEILSGPEPTKDETDARVRRWMAIECFYIHLRNLHAFFYGGRDKPRDAIAVDFYVKKDEWRTGARRPKQSDGMRTAVARAGTMVAHLSYDRHTHLAAGERLQWLDLAQEMESIWNAFQDGLAGGDARVPLGSDFAILPQGAIMTVSLGYGSATTVSTPVRIEELLPLFVKEQR
jgi:hypothetical protein